MFIVPKFPHLQNLRLEIMYRELPPDESYMYKWTHPWKYKQDPDGGGNHGFAPNDKYYINGVCVGESQRVQFAKLAKTPPPLPPRRRAPFDGITEVFPGEPNYERLCREQGLEYLLLEGGGAGVAEAEGDDHSTSRKNGMTPAAAADNTAAVLQNGTAGFTPPESNASADAEMHDVPPSASAAEGIPSNGPLTNGVLGATAAAAASGSGAD